MAAGTSVPPPEAENAATALPGPLPAVEPFDWPADLARIFERRVTAAVSRGADRPDAERREFAWLDGVARILHVPPPEPMPWRTALAGWPAAWRRAWGERANELDDGIRDWREAERLAFAEVNARRASGESPG